MAASLKRRAAIPSDVTGGPDLMPGLDWYLRAFEALSTTRQIATGALGPIPWTAISEYGHRYEVTPLLFEYLAHHIAWMDAEYLKWEEKESKKRKGGGGGGRPEVRGEHEEEGEGG